MDFCIYFGVFVFVSVCVFVRMCPTLYLSVLSIQIQILSSMLLSFYLQISNHSLNLTYFELSNICSSSCVLTNFDAMTFSEFWIQVTWFEMIKGQQNKPQITFMHSFLFAGKISTLSQRIAIFQKKLNGLGQGHSICDGTVDLGGRVVVTRTLKHNCLSVSSQLDTVDAKRKKSCPSIFILLIGWGH